MEEILARLARIEAELESINYRLEHSQENAEAANERRRDDINRIEGKLRDLENEMYYKIDQVRNEIDRSSRGW